MKYKKTGIAILGIILLLVVLFLYFKSTSEPIVLSSNDLINDTSNSNFLIDKEIIVIGVVKEKLFEHGKHALILKGNKYNEIICQFNSEKTSSLDLISNNQCVHIKGVYKGELSGLILLHCELLETTCND